MTDKKSEQAKTGAEFLRARKLAELRARSGSEETREHESSIAKRISERNSTSFRTRG